MQTLHYDRNYKTQEFRHFPAHAAHTFQVKHERRFKFFKRASFDLYMSMGLGIQMQLADPSTDVL
jgi:hypothetical protein